MQVLAVIPARSGSKGIPMKNIQKLAGKPLIQYTISSARNSKNIDRIIVSTDSYEIAKISKLAGADVPFLRPKKFSLDSSSTLDVVKHALRFLSLNQSYIPDIIVILQPTSPLRTINTIDKSIEILKKSNATSVVSVSKIKEHPYASFWYRKKYLKPFKPNSQKYYRRQDIPPLYYPTGSIYTFWHNTLKKYNSIYGPKIKPMIIKEDEFNLDVDNVFNLFTCEMTIRYWKKYKKRFSH